MNKKTKNIGKKKIAFFGISLLALLLFAAFFIWFGTRESTQSEEPVIAGVRFEGEYKIGGGEWRPIVKDSHIPATKGDVTLRGVFLMLDPFTNEPVGPVSEGITVSLYLNHIHCSVLFPNGEQAHLDAESDSLGEDSCAAMWGGFVSTTPGTPENPNTVTVFLHNPHSFGNDTAVDELLQSLSIAPGAHFETKVLDSDSFERGIGAFIIIMSLIILGIAAFSSIIHIKYSKELWLIGLMSFFAGVYIIFGTLGISIRNNSNIANTKILGLSMMLYMLFISELLVLLLKGVFKRIAFAATLTSASSVLICMSLSFFKSIKFYDTWIYWTVVELAVVTTLILCQLLSLKKASATEKFLLITGALSLSAFPIDVIATKFGWWSGGFVSKHVFVAVFIMALVVVAQIIPSHINAAIKLKELEAEQQALKLELQESRISIILSQMQPHFIFNTLNTIYQLCEIDPAAARSTISSFSEYLRNNIDNLGQSDMISFEKELSFVRTYLDIEKVRFDDELEIAFDVQATDFKLPVLTVQPIVENAVKHGTSSRTGIARISVSTRETDSHYEITVSDNGSCFDPASRKDDGHKHIGITSVKQRLAYMCGGSLTVEFQDGVGTKSIIKIPKEEKANEDISCG